MITAGLTPGSDLGRPDGEVSTGFDPPPRAIPVPTSPTTIPRLTRPDPQAHQPTSTGSPAQIHRLTSPDPQAHQPRSTGSPAQIGGFASQDPYGATARRPRTVAVSAMPRATPGLCG